MVKTRRSGRSSTNKKQQAQPDASSNSNPTATSTTNEVTGADEAGDASSNSNPTATSTTNEVTGADEAGGGSGQRVATVEQKISQLLQKKKDPDAPKNLLAMLQENWQECSAELGEDLIKGIIKIFKLPTSNKDYRTRLEKIIVSGVCII
jgi:hypothetical protein